jgi:undecaprenyl-diphosphatase
VSWRTTAINEITRIGSDLGATTTIIGIAAVSTIVLAIGRWWRQVGLLLGALAIEASGALTSSIVVARPRPTVPYLDAAPPTSSFPSGHTAAAIVLYVCLAIILTSIFRNFFVRVASWSLAILLPMYVGFSRLYRGMHHPTDVVGSLLLAAGALVFGMLGVRVAVRVAEIRKRASASVHGLPRIREDMRQSGIGA